MKAIRKKENRTQINRRKTVSFLAAVMLSCVIWPIRADAGYVMQGVCQAETDVGGWGTVKTLDYGYEDIFLCGISPCF